MKCKFLLICYWAISLMYSQNVKALENLTEQKRKEMIKSREYLQKAKNRGFHVSKEVEKGLIRIASNGMPIFVEAFEDRENKTLNADYLWDLQWNGNDYSLDGSTMTMHIWDGGNIRSTHQEFSNNTFSRVTNLDDSNISNHSTAVAGTIGAFGVDAMAKGVAPNITIVGRDFQDSEEEIAATIDAKISNHSYGVPTGWIRRDNAPFGNNPGEGYYLFSDYSVSTEEPNWNGNYTDESVFWDEVSYNNPEHILVRAAGNSQGYGPNGQEDNYYVWNAETEMWVVPTEGIPINNCADGYDCMYVDSTAKNVIVVGAINHLETQDDRYSSPSDPVLTTFSSIGPRDDGGIKPDLVAVGLWVYSSSGWGDDVYINAVGTSFSSPAVAGVVALIDELYHMENNSYMRSDLAKALLIHTANECGENPGPDYRFGWGLPNALEAASTILNHSISTYVRSERVWNSEEHNFEIIASGISPVKATISWLDPAAIPIPNSVDDRTSRLINDLDLTITDSVTNEVLQTWKLDPENPSAPAIHGDNTVDNVEQVIIENPVAGRTYKVKVTHKGILKDADFNPVSNVQFGIVLSGGEITDLNSEEVISPKFELTVFPNPSQDWLNFKTEEKISSVSIFNAEGKLVIYNNQLKDYRVEVKHLEKGVYRAMFNIKGKKQIKSFVKR